MGKLVATGPTSNWGDGQHEKPEGGHSRQKRKENLLTMPFRFTLMRSQVLYRAALDTAGTLLLLLLPCVTSDS